MTDREAVDFLRKAVIYLGGRRTNRKQITWELYTEAMEKAINALEEKTMALPIPRSSPHGEWIPCEDRLPEEDGQYLVFLPDRNGTFMCADFLNGQWYPDDYECTSNHVIAWMPLPKPYKKEGEAE